MVDSALVPGVVVMNVARGVAVVSLLFNHGVNSLVAVETATTVSVAGTVVRGADLVLVVLVVVVTAEVGTGTALVLAALRLAVVAADVRIGRAVPLMVTLAVLVTS